MLKSEIVKWLSGTTLFLCLQVKLSAQDSLTVEEAITTALINNYDILLSKKDSASIAISNEYRNAVFLPTLNATSTILFNNNAQNQKFTDGTERKRTGIKTNNLNAALNLNWTLFDGLKMFLLKDRLNVEILRGSLTIKNQVINTISDVIKTYYDIVRQKQLLKNIEEQMALSADRLRLAQYKLDIGVGIKPDVLQAQIDFNTQKAARINQLAVIDQRKSDLNLLMNIIPVADYTVSDTIMIRNDFPLAYGLSGNLSANSPALQLAKSNIDRAMLDIREARAERFPTIAFVSAYNFNRNTNSSVINPIAQALFSLNKGFNYGLTASIPIFNKFTVRQQILQTRLSAEYLRLQYQNQQSVIKNNLENNLRNFRAQQEIVEVNDSNILLARENLMIERERYRLGVTTFIELRQAEENLANAVYSAITTRYNLKVAETELLRLTGDLIR